MSNMSHKLRKQARQNSMRENQKEWKNKEKFRWFKIKLVTINIFIALIFWLCRNLSAISTGVITLYEIILIVISIISLNPKTRIRKYVGWWNLFVPFCMGLLWNDYSFYNDRENLFSFGKPALIILAVSACIGVLIVFMIKNMRSSQKGNVLILPIIMMIITLSVSGQIINLNAVLGAEKISTESYVITDKYEESFNTPFTLYYLNARKDESHSINVKVKKTNYKKAAVGSTLMIPVYIGFFGIEYLEDISLIVNKQIDDM